MTGDDFIRVYDDANYVIDNPYIKSGLNADSIRWAFTTTRMANWHPVTWISHILDWQLYGANPAGHHLTNLIIHIINVLLLFYILCRLTGRTRRSLVVAALFAVHPLHVQSVAWIAERKDVLSTMFGLLMILAYVRYVESPRLRRYMLVAAAFILGLMSKPMLVSMPFLLLLLDYWPLYGLIHTKKENAPGIRWFIWNKIPLIALTAVACNVTIWAQDKGGAVVTLHWYPMGVRAVNAIVSYAIYIGKTLWPVNLAIFYPHPGASIPTWQVFGSCVLFMAVSAIVLRCARSRPYIAFGWLWYVISLVPVIGLVQVGDQAMADRYAYIPHIGLFIAAVWTAADLLEQLKNKTQIDMRKVAVIISAGVISILIVCTVIQVGYWRDSETLFSRAKDVTTGNSVACYNLGLALQRQGRNAEAIENYREALRIGPDNPDSRINLGLLLLRGGEYKDAEEQFASSLKFRKGWAKSQQGLAMALAAQGKQKEAIDHYLAALQANPRDARTHYNLGSLLASMDLYDEAVKHLSAATRISPGYVAAHHNLGLVYQLQGKFDSAIEEHKTAVRCDPTNPELHETLAACLYCAGDYAHAWREVDILRRLGAEPDQAFIKALAAKMPEPRR